MDSLTDPAVERTVVMTSAQVGKTEIINNSVGYFIDQDACPILVVQPTLEMAESWSKERLAPMIRDTPALKGKIADSRSRDSGNTILHKLFPGGHLTICGANSPASLASRPIRVVMLDEVDRYTVTSEGDPVRLALKRSNNFWNRRILLVSTPTLSGLSRIEKEFELSDKRYFYVRCPHCEDMHILQWRNVCWDGVSPAGGDPKKAVMRCPACENYFSNAQKNLAVSKGEWRATAPFTGIAGFHLNELYSPWRTIAEVVADFLSAKDDPAQLQVWVNTSLGEPFDDGGACITEHELLDRCEEYKAEVPEKVLILTAGIDTHPDRLEVEVTGWAGGEESWSIDYKVIHGDPDIAEGLPGSPWDDLTDFLRKRWKHESGLELSIHSSCIDSGGLNTQAVYGYVKSHRGERIHAIKGKGGDGVPIVGASLRKRSGKKMKRPVEVFLIGTDQAKSTIYNRLKIEEAGPGYCHFPNWYGIDYFRQLTAEKQVTRFVRGFPKREWKKKEGQRNEALDCRVYSFAAFILAGVQMDKLAYRMKLRKAELTNEGGRKLPEQMAGNEESAIEEVEICAQDQVVKTGNITQTKRRIKRRPNSYLHKWRS